MANEPKLVVKKRTKLGSAESRRLRRRGLIPGNVYGHDQDPVAVAVQEDELRPVVVAGSRVVDVEIDGQTEKALFREVQWDTYGTQIYHFDLLRVDPRERVTVEVPIELRGIAPGVLGGGILDQQLRTLSLECLAYQIPDAIHVRIGSLNIGDSIHVSDVALPSDSMFHNPPEAIVVQVSQPTGGLEEAEEAAEGEEEAAEEPGA